MQSALFVWRPYLSAMLCMLGCMLMTAAHAEGNRKMDIDVEISDGEVRANVSLFVRATRQRVWEVINDYDGAADFMRGLRESRVIARTGDTLRVYQKDMFRFGPFTFPVETVKDVKLIAPTRTESRLVRGSIDKYEATTELVQEPGGTRIIYRSVAVPGSVLASFASESTVRRETEERFSQLRAEIMRREQVALKQ